MRFNTSRLQVGWTLAMCAALLSWESAHGVSVRAQELVVGPGETRKLSPGRHTFELVELSDGSAIELTSGHTVIETARLSTVGTSSIRSDKSHAGAEKNVLELVVLDTAEMAETLVIDGSGAGGGAGAGNGGGVGDVGGRGEDGMTVDLTLVHRAGLVDFIERFIDGRGFSEGRLKVISRGGSGGRGGNGGGGTKGWLEHIGGGQRGPGVTISHEGTAGHAGGNGGNGGDGGAVSVRFVMLDAESVGAEVLGLHMAESPEPGRRRRIGGEDFPSVRELYREGLGLEVEVVPGSRGDAGATGIYGSARGQKGEVGKDGSVTVEALDWESWVETSAGRRWIER